MKNKVNDSDGFLGATDSAVPCSQILHLVSQLDKELKESKEKVIFSLSLFLLYNQTQL
jgi:hypothetical protein